MPRTQEQSDMDDPEQHFAWAFAAGVPDPRGERFGNQPLIPAPCFPALSKMLWDMGFRHHAELQTRWVNQYSGPDRNFVALGVTDVSPESLLEQATEMLVDQFPDVAARVAAMTPENRDQMVREQAAELMASVERLKAARARLEGGEPK